MDGVLEHCAQGHDDVANAARRFALASHLPDQRVNVARTEAGEGAVAEPGEHVAIDDRSVRGDCGGGEPAAMGWVPLVEPAKRVRVEDLLGRFSPGTVIHGPQPGRERPLGVLLIRADGLVPALAVGAVVADRVAAARAFDNGSSRHD